MSRQRPIRPGFEQRLLATLRACALSGQRVTVAFSGGPDSLALAAALQRIAPLLDLNILLAHVDHALRATSAQDAERCREIATGLGLPIETMRLGPDLHERARGLGIEEQGRRERYRAIASIATSWKSDTILTGHQANDQAETLLLHLFRGTGLQGLGGMRLQETRPIPWWRPVDQDSSPFRIVRPLLSESRRTIESYLEESELIALLDESNASVDFDRNFVRQRVLPVVEERWPAIVETLGRSAQILQLDADFLDELANAALLKRGSLVRTLRTDDLLELDRALAHRVLRRWLEEIGVEDAGFDVVARIYELAETHNESAAIEVRSGKVVVVAGDELTTLGGLLEEASRTMPLAAEADIERWSIEWGSKLPQADGSMMLPSEGAAIVRQIRPGDCWFGSRRPVFEDLRVAGIHPQVRKHLLAVVTEGGVLLIPAIYPTIRTKMNGLHDHEVSIRWWKQG